MNCIVLDQGNTSLKWGHFSDNTLRDSGRILNTSLENELVALHTKHNLPIYYSSVRSDEEQIQFLETFPFCKKIPQDYFPKYTYSSGEAGKDRLANISGAFNILDCDSCLVVDFGTCITYSIGKKNILQSGVISLGVQSRLRALHEFTGKLPKLSFTAVSEPFQSSTAGALLSSVNFGILFELKGFIDAALTEYPGIQIIFTGSDAVHFAEQLNYRIFVELNLTLIGLYAICCANES